MKKLIYLFTFLALSGILFSSCKDKDKAEPFGAVKATVSPAGSATNMRVVQGSTTYETTPDGSGNFQINNLAAGDYSVKFTPKIPYQAPAARNITVNAGQTTDLGSVTLTQMGSQFFGTMSANINGTAWNAAFPVATIRNGTLTITGPTADVSGGTAISGEAIVLAIQNPTGVGTYHGPVNATANFEQASSAGAVPSSWTTFGFGTNCTVTITKFDQTNKKISGTFSFLANAIPNTPATGIKTVSNGTFTDLNLQ